jgi:maltooligosyltrehalose trehalohydrolase
MLAFYRHLLELRWSIPHVVSKRNLMVEALPRQKVMIWHRRHEWGQVSGLLNFAAEPQEVPLPLSQRTWVKILDSADPKWDGPGAAQLAMVAGRQRVTMPPRSIAVFQAESAQSRKGRVAERPSPPWK